MLYNGMVLGQLAVSGLRRKCVVGVTQEYVASVYKFSEPGYTTIVWDDTIKVQGISIFRIRLGVNVNRSDFYKKGKHTN